VIFQDAPIHHNEDACLARLFGCPFVDYFFLHPHRWDF
jgi:hypothetical protein